MEPKSSNRGKNADSIVLFLVVACSGFAMLYFAGSRSEQRTSGINPTAYTTPAITSEQVQVNIQPTNTLTDQQKIYPAPQSPVALPVPTTGGAKPNVPVHIISSGAPILGTPADVAKLAKIVIVGTIKEVMPARWSTSDGIRPSDPWSSSTNAFIYTPVTIVVQENLKGQTANSSISLYVPGGTVGNDIFEITPAEQFTFKTGEHVVLFLNESVQAYNGAFYDFLDRYTVDSDGQAQNARDKLPLEKLREMVIAASRS